MNYETITKLLPESSLDIIQRLGCDPVTSKPLVCDGVLGPKTRGATYLPIDKLLAKTSIVALKELLDGSQELNGNNRGKFVNKYFRSRAGASELKNRGAWCASAVSWIYNQVSPFRACWGAIRLVRDLMQRITTDEAREGDAVCWRSLTRPWPYGHVGIIVLVEDDFVWSIEGNVDLMDGLDGVAARRLTKDLNRSDGNKAFMVGRVKEKAKP